MPISRLPVLNLPQPPEKFNTLEEAREYLVDLSRELETYFSRIDNVISNNYQDVDGGSP